MGQRLKEPAIIPSSLFAIEPSRRSGQQIHDIGLLCRKRVASVISPTFFSRCPQGTNVNSSISNDNGNTITDIATVSSSTKALRKALAVLSKNTSMYQKLDCDGINVNANTTVVRNFVTTQTRDSDSISVSSTSTTSSILSGEGDGYDSNDEDESESDTEKEEEVPTTSLPPPDALFVVQGADFPCHTHVLLKEAPPLYDILSRDGVLERKTKRQRTTSDSSASTSASNSTLQLHETQQLQTHQEQEQAWSSPSGITVARLSDGIDSNSFRVIMEYLYLGEIKLQMQEEDEIEGEIEDPWLADGERMVDGNDLFAGCDSDAEEFFGDDFSVMEFPTAAKPQEAEQSPMKFLQGVFVLAEQFGCVSLKQAIETKLYDEFLFAFTAEELHKWAEEHKCSLLKEKAREKLVATKLKKCKRERKKNLIQDELLLY